PTVQGRSPPTATGWRARVRTLPLADRALRSDPPAGRAHAPCCTRAARARMIGAKSLVTVFACALGAVLTWRSGVLAPERLGSRAASALFFAGAFAVLVGTLVFRFWRLGERSASYFRLSIGPALFENEGSFVSIGRVHITVGRNDAEAFDLGARTQQLL